MTGVVWIILIGIATLVLWFSFRTWILSIKEEEIMVKK